MNNPSRLRPTRRITGMRTALALCAGVASGAFGCAQSVGDIDRTQPELISKDHFSGQWFLRETVIDVPGTSPVSFVGDQGSLEQVVWDIQEDWLVGYRSYELVPGLDGNANTDLSNPSSTPITPGRGEGRDPETYRGNPVVAYKISGHFDVQRGYNARTGEQNNVISENSSDRPWYERDFMRVNWSSNDVDSFLTEARAFWPMFGVQSTMSSYIPANEGGANALKKVDEDGDGLYDYIDFTVRRTVEPTIAGCSAMFQSQVGDCTGEEIQIRTSLLKVDVEREQDYVPMVYSDARQGEFGYFRVERPSYDRDLGPTFSGLIQMASRHDIWADSRDPSGEPRAYSDRTLRPIVYTLSENYPEEMYEITEQIGRDYDEIFKDTAAAARGQTREQLEADLLADSGRECLFCVDRNTDNGARNGDLRHNFIYWVDDVQAVSPLGYGPSSSHPETGRIVSASAYVYGASVDRYAEYAKEIVDLMNGNAGDDDIIDRSYFREIVGTNLPSIDPRAAERIDTLENGFSDLLSDGALSRMAELQEHGADALRSVVPGQDRARLSLIEGTPLEAAMVPEEWAALSAQDGLYHFLSASYEARRAEAIARGEEPKEESPLGPLALKNWFGPESIQPELELEEIASRNNLMLINFDDPLIFALAEEMRRENITGEALRQELRERIYRDVMLHEIGHTVGLRHNFGASADPLNYHPEYWDERVKTIEPLSEYINGSGQTAPNTNAFLRSNCTITEPLTTTQGLTVPGTGTAQACQEQREAGMVQYQYSSIMDYGSRFNSKIEGLGHYDRAAIASGYGNLVEVFDEDAVAAMQSAGSAMGLDVRQAILEANERRNPVLYQGLDTALVYQSQNGMLRGHYANFPAIFGGHENMERRRFVSRSEYFSSLRDGGPTAPVKVPYMSCYDEFVDSVETCHRWDTGADHYEIVQDKIQTYKNYYLFNNYQRDRLGFNPINVMNRTRMRYFLPLNNMYQHWVWGAFITGIAQQGTPRGELALLATLEGRDLLLNTLSTPEYGAHVYDSESGMYVDAGAESCPDVIGDVLVQAPGDANFVSMPNCVNVARGVGRSFFSRFDTGGYDIYRRVLESGHFYEQIAALDALNRSDASVVGIGSDVNADARTFRIPYNLLFQEDLAGTFSAIWQEQDNLYAQHIMRDADGVGQVLGRNPLSPVSNDEMSQLPVIEPGRSYTTRRQALLVGMLMLDGALSPKFARQGQISLAGSGEQRNVPEGFEAVELADPLSGRSYVAYRRVDGEGGPWYAADMLDEARQILETSENPGEIESVFGDIEFVRLASRVLGEERLR